MDFIRLMLCYFLISVFKPTTSLSQKLLLSSLIKEGRIEEARKASSVNSSYFLNVTSYSGFLTVDYKYNSNIFFWYFPALNVKDVEKTPWILWLQGGPGATSLVGLFDEIGPFKYNEGSRKLQMNQWSWGKNYSLLFVDNPVGAGYSYTDSEEGYVQNMDTCSEHLYSVLQQFLTMFPELRHAPLYLGGESYAGKYIPALGVKIMDSSTNHRKNETINLEGVLMGNPALDREDIADYSSLFYNWGLVDTQDVLAAKPLQDAYNKAIANNESGRASDLRNQLLDKLLDTAFQQQTYNILQDDLKFRGFEQYLKMEHIRDAIHVGNAEYSFSSHIVHVKLRDDFLAAASPQVEKLLERYKVMIYCGQLDLTTSCVQSARARRRKWQWSHRNKFLSASRDPWWYNNSVAGYVKKGGGLTEVLVRGAGHIVPMDKPAQAQQLISYFIRGLELPQPTNYKRLSDTPKYVDFGAEQAPLFVHRTTNDSTGLTISVAINVILVLGIAVAIFFFIRWKRKNDFFYNTTDDMTDSILTMS